MLNDIIKELDKREEIIDGHWVVHCVNYGHVAKGIIKLIDSKKANIKSIVKASNDQYQRMLLHQKKYNEIPDWWKGYTSVSTDILETTESYIKDIPNLLHKFFNHKSDANKYLTAEQQEELENDFSNWIKSEMEEI